MSIHILYFLIKISIFFHQLHIKFDMKKVEVPSQYPETHFLTFSPSVMNVQENSLILFHVYL